MKCLDTSLLIDLTHAVPEAQNAAEAAEAVGAVTTEVNAFELYVGAHREGRPVTREMEAVDAVLRRIDVLPLTRQASLGAAAIASQLRSRGRAVGTLDILIAAIALVHGVDTIVTHDAGDFRRIPGLRVETYL